MTSSSRLFVGSLPFRFSEGELLDLFVPYGRVIFIRIVKDKFHKSRGLAFVEFDSVDSAVAAQKALHGYYLIDRTIIVDFAKPDPKSLVGETSDPQSETVFRPSPRPQTQPTDQAPARSKSFKSRRPQTRPTQVRGADAKGHLRQSVFNSRVHGSRPGKKFASRTRKKS
jgi:RNA recognition motif-containing protein